MNKFKVGDRVEAVKETTDITIGKIYTVVEIGLSGDTVCILDNVQERHWRSVSFFKLASRKFVVIAAPFIEVETYEAAVAKVNQYARENAGGVYAIAPAGTLECYQLVTAVQRVDS